MASCRERHHYDNDRARSWARRRDLPAAPAAWETGLRPEVSKRQALARRGMLQYAPPSRFHVWINDLTMRAITLPGVSNLVRKGIERANR